MDGEEENGETEGDHDFLENGRDGLTGTPDSANSRNDKELEELMEVESTAAKTCIMHALSIVSASAPQPGSSPPPLAAVAPLATVSDDTDNWKTQGHTRLSPKIRHEPY